MTSPRSLAAAGITFAGTSATPGYWKGLAFLSNDVANSLAWVEVTGAGSDEAFCCGFFVGSVDAKAGLLVGDTRTAARLSLQHSTVSHSAHDGLFAYENAKLDGFAANACAPAAPPS